MKQKEEKKLRLGKNTIQQLNIELDRDEQRNAKGGSDIVLYGTTNLPVFC